MTSKVTPSVVEDGERELPDDGPVVLVRKRPPSVRSGGNVYDTLSDSDVKLFRLFRLLARSVEDCVENRDKILLASVILQTRAGGDSRKNLEDCPFHAEIE